MDGGGMMGSLNARLEASASEKGANLAEWIRLAVILLRMPFTVIQSGSEN